MTMQNSIGSFILDTGKTPEQWVDVLAARGIDMSVRTLREKANRLGACYKPYRATMIITAEQLDTILMGGTRCRSKSISEDRHGGREATSSTTGGGSPNTSARALDHLLRQARGTGAKSK